MIVTAIWSSAVLLSQPGKSKALRRRWIVADDRGNLELLSDVNRCWNSPIDTCVL